MQIWLLFQFWSIRCRCCCFGMKPVNVCIKSIVVCLQHSHSQSEMSNIQDAVSTLLEMGVRARLAAATANPPVALRHVSVRLKAEFTMRYTGCCSCWQTDNCCSVSLRSCWCRPSSTWRCPWPAEEEMQSFIPQPARSCKCCDITRFHVVQTMWVSKTSSRPSTAIL